MSFYAAAAAAAALAEAAAQDESHLVRDLVLKSINKGNNVDRQSKNYQLKQLNLTKVHYNYMH